MMFLLFLVALEILLRVSGFFNTWDERINGAYQYKYGQVAESWFHTWPKNETISYGGDEFTYQNHYNDLGHRDINFKDFKEKTQASKYIFLGDSFTEGDGAPWDSTWVKTFENRARSQIDSNMLAYNAGVCGSDIFFNYIMLKENLLQAKPKVVFECVNISDVMDVYYFGGLERFQEDGTTKSREPIKWEPVFKYSHVFRLIVVVFTPYNRRLTNEATIDQDEAQIVEDIAAQIKLTHSLCAESDIDYYLIYMPTPECKQNFNRCQFDSLPSLLHGQVPVIDIFPCIQGKLTCENLYEYSWERNRHYNSKGYDLMGECIFEEFVKLTVK